MMRRLLPWCIAVFLALLPTYLVRFPIGRLPSTLLEVLFGALVVLWLLARPDWHKIAALQHEHRTLWYAGILFFVAGTVSLFVAADMRTAAGLWKAYFLEPMLFFLICYTSLSLRDVWRCIAALSVSSAVIAAVALVQFYAIPEGITLFGHTFFEIPNPYWRELATRRATSVFEYPNAIGLFLAPLLPFFFLALVEHWRARIQSLRRHLFLVLWYVLVIAASLFAILLAASSGAIAGILGTLFVAAVACRKTRWYAVAIVVIFWAVVPFTHYWKPIREEFFLQNYSGKIRVQMWKETMQQLETAPLLGNGLGMYQESIAPYHKFQWAEIYLYPHNLFLNFWTETGVLGIITFLAIVVWAWVVMWRQRSPLSFAAAAALLILVIHGLVDVPYFKNDLAMVFWFVIATLLVARQNKAKTLN